LILKSAIIMKKAKMLLTALTVLTVVGGALAFKSKDAGSTIYCAQAASPFFCNVTTPDFTLTSNGTSPIQSPCVAASQNATCSSVSVYSQF
jgi:hypothetical protein